MCAITDKRIQSQIRVFDEWLAGWLTLYWDLAEHRGGLVLVAQNCLCLLIVKTGPWDGTIMRDPLFVVNAIVGLPPRTKRELSTCVVTCVRLLKVAGQLVRARLWESVKVLYSSTSQASLVSWVERFKRAEQWIGLDEDGSFFSLLLTMFGVRGPMPNEIPFSLSVLLRLYPMEWFLYQRQVVLRVVCVSRLKRWKSARENWSQITYIFFLFWLLKRAPMPKVNICFEEDVLAGC